ASGTTPAAAAVVVGLDREFDYQILAAAQQAILGGALFVATNTDSTFPVEGAVLPGGGAIVEAVASATNRRPVVVGKPEPKLAQALIDGAGGAPRSILFVGDRLGTDIEMARRAGLRSALVLTGVTGRSELGSPGQPVPDHVLESLEDLPALLDDLGAGPALR
ncbi:MAG: HAD-IIA family hydrolase, partial [Thermoleophilia bacterium]